MRMTNFVTIYTDASMCSKTKAGGWGSWIKYGNNQSITFSGSFKDPLNDSTEGELKAIANAVTRVAKHISPKNSVIVVVTDSQGAIGYLERNYYHKSKNKKLAEICIYIKSQIPPCCKLIIKKVKAHSNDDGKRSYVNSVVDSAAMRHMKEKRKELELLIEEKSHETH